MTNFQPNYKLAAFGMLLLAAGIALGAFGAHGLKNIATEKYVDVFETGVRYQVYTALGLIVLSLFGEKLFRPSLLIIAGMWIFSVSLYFLSLNETWGSFLKKLGAITPIGGLLMIAGWCWAAVLTVRMARKA
jgi:uncharacterized membrane protein YgdD (TMEM256/DUF423 family)